MPGLTVAAQEGVRKTVPLKAEAGLETRWSGVPCAVESFA
jgi:hypothetical protein